jgi:hypothetical protein
MDLRKAFKTNIRTPFTHVFLAHSSCQYSHGPSSAIESALGRLEGEGDLLALTGGEAIEERVTGKRRSSGIDGALGQLLRRAGNEDTAKGMIVDDGRHGPSVRSLLPTAGASSWAITMTGLAK